MNRFVRIYIGLRASDRSVIVVASVNFLDKSKFFQRCLLFDVKSTLNEMIIVTLLTECISA